MGNIEVLFRVSLSKQKYKACNNYMCKVIYILFSLCINQNSDWFYLKECKLSVVSYILE